MQETYEQILSTMERRYTELTGFTPDSASDIGIRLKVLAQELAALYDTFHAMRQELFPQTSSGAYLEMHAQTRGLVRKGGIRAVGTLRFTRSSPASMDIPIPAGTLCSTRGEPLCRFVTAEDGVLRAGESWAEIPSVAVEVGESMNVAAGAVVMMITPVSQVGEVTNPSPFVGGADEEGDEALRGRLLESYQVVANGTNAASYLQKALSFDGITSARVLPRRRGTGTVDVVVTSAGQPPEEALLTQMREELSAWKEINVDLQILAAKTKSIAVEVAVEAGEDVQFSQLEQELRSSLLGLMTSQRVGEPLRLAQLSFALMQDRRVVNCHILAPVEDVAVQEDEVIVPAGLTIQRLGGY